MDATEVAGLRREQEYGDARRRSTLWTAMAMLEVVIAAVAVAVDLVVPTLVILALLTVSLVVRQQHLDSIGLIRVSHASRIVVDVLWWVVAWSLLQLGLMMPILNHLTGQEQNLSDLAGVEGSVGMLALFLLLTWTVAAFGEEIAYRGYLPTRIRDVVGGRAGMVLAVLITSGLFGLAHTEQGVIGVVVTFLDAIFFSVLRVRYRTLWAPILAHGFNNTIGLVAFFLVGPIHGFW